MRKIDNSPEKETARQALREKFEKEYAPLLQKEEVEPVESFDTEPIEEVDFSVYEGTESLNNRINDKNRKNEKYIKESNKLIKRFRNVNFKTNSIVDSLMYRDVETEYIVQYFSKKIGDNPKNRELLLNILKNETANFNMFTSFASSGKTFTVNTIFNDYREYRKHTDENFLIDLCVNGISDPVVKKMIDDKVNRKLEKFQYENCTVRNKVQKMKRAKVSPEKIKAVEDAFNQKVEEEKRRILFEYFKGEFERRKLGSISKVEEINEYVENNPTSLIQVLVTPNRIQNEQNQEEEKYNFTAIIGQNGKEIKFDADTNYSVVIEKLTEVLNKIEKSLVKTKINLVIDEAHVLVEQKGFRSEAINCLIQVVSRVLELDGTVIFMTATPENLKCFNFDKIISFIPVEDVKNADKVKVYMNTDKNLSMHDYTLSVIKHLNNPLVRYNTKDGIARAKEVLESFGYKVETVTADDKKKELFRSIVKKSALIKADKWLCSSVIEVGTNIIGVIREDGSIALVDITPTYVMHDINNCSFDSMEQFFARIRYKVSEYALIIPEKKSTGESVKCVNTLLNEEIGRVEIYFDKLSEIAATYLRVIEDKAEAIENIKRTFEVCKSADGAYYHCNCIYFDEETLETKVDTIALWKNVYKSYIQQYYYHPELLMNRLSETLGLPVEFATDSIDKVKTKDVNTSDIIKAIAKDTLKSLSNADIKELEQVVSKEISIEDIKKQDRREKIETILKVKSYAKYLKEAYNLSVDFAKIVSVIVNASKEKEITEFLQKAFYVKGNLLYLSEKTTLSIEQDIIINALYKTKEDNSVIERRISKEDIENLSVAIGKATKKKVKKNKKAESEGEQNSSMYGIGYDETFKLLEYIFILQTVGKDSEVKYKIRGLNTSLKTSK